MHIQQSDRPTQPPPPGNARKLRDQSEDSLRITALDYAWRTLSSQPHGSSDKVVGYTKDDVLATAREYLAFLSGNDESKPNKAA
jgi:hypothetical protein